MENEVAIEIKNIFAQNQLEDLKRFMAKRQSLNSMNTFLIYFFHIFNSAGILVTTIATGYNMRELIWVGVGLNVVSSLMNVFEKINTSISTKLMKDIKSIREGTYVDEGTIINEVKNKDESKSGDVESGSGANQLD
jgi:hypothetical protein